MSLVHVMKHKAEARYDIPPAMAREIGRFLVTWAHFEDYLQGIIGNTIDLSMGERRLLLREPRVPDRLDMIRDLAESRNLEVDFVLLLEIRKRAEKLTQKRNLVTHSIWQKPGAYWVALDTRGEWAEPQKAIPDYPEGSKRFEPEAIPVSADDIREWTTQTIKLIDDTMRLGDQNRPVPSPEKQKPRSASKGQRAGRRG